MSCALFLSFFLKIFLFTEKEHFFGLTSRNFSYFPTFLAFFSGRTLPPFTVVKLFYVTFYFFFPVCQILLYWNWDSFWWLCGLSGYPMDQLRGKIFPLNAPLCSLLPLKEQRRRPRYSFGITSNFVQLGLRGLAVLFLSEEQAYLLAKKRLP